MGLECPLLLSREPATGPYAEPYVSSSHLVTQCLKIYLNIIFPSTPRSPKLSLPFSSIPTKILSAFLISLTPASLTLLHLITLIIFSVFCKTDWGAADAEVHMTENITVLSIYSLSLILSFFSFISSLFLHLPVPFFFLPSCLSPFFFSSLSFVWLIF